MLLWDSFPNFLSCHACDCLQSVMSIVTLEYLFLTKLDAQSIIGNIDPNAYPHLHLTILVPGIVLSTSK